MKYLPFSFMKSEHLIYAFADVRYLGMRVPPDHPLRIIKKVADDVLDRMSGDFDRMYSRIGRASVPPERLLKSLLLISLYSIRSERAFCEELDYNLLYQPVS